MNYPFDIPATATALQFGSARMQQYNRPVVGEPTAVIVTFFRDTKSASKE